MFKKIRNIHFIGIGGSGMSGIAEVLLTLKYNVTGSDLKESDVTKRLVSLGSTIYLGHRAENIKDAHVVVTSTAVKSDNPELIESLRRKIPVIPRIEMLAEIGRLKYAVTIAGTHGKTTTTSLVSLVLQAGGLDPTVVVGGRMHNIGTGARVGLGDYLVAESDESDGSFLKLAPTLGVITNIDDDHLDYWGDMPALYRAFETYANKVPFYGRIFICVDDEGCKKILGSVRRPMTTYGLSADAEIRAVDIRAAGGMSTYTVMRGGEKLGEVRWAVPGRHNVINSLAAVGIGLELGVPFKTIAEALASFKGVGRRMEVKGEAGGVVVVDDYGHHPTEIRATLQALREKWPERRCLVAFQPHRYSRTQILADEFASSFEGLDQLLLLDIYAAGEKPIDGVTSDWLAGKIAANKLSVKRVLTADGPSALRPFVKPGDVVLTLGAGDVWKLGENLLNDLAKK